MLRLYRYCAFIGNQPDTRLAYKHAQRPSHADKHILHCADIGVVSHIYLEVFTAEASCRCSPLATATPFGACIKITEVVRSFIRLVISATCAAISAGSAFVAASSDSFWILSLQAVQFADNVGHFAYLPCALSCASALIKMPFFARTAPHRSVRSSNLPRAAVFRHPPDGRGLAGFAAVLGTDLGYAPCRARHPAGFLLFAGVRSTLRLWF